MAADGVLTVRLARGKAKKAPFNGSLAHVMSTRGGWASVAVQGQRIKWRSGHWVASGGAGLLVLPDDQLVQVARYLPTPSLCAFFCVARRTAALRSVAAQQCFTECHLRDGVPCPLGVARSKQLEFAKYLCAQRARLQSLHIELIVYELCIAAWVLRECDTTALTSVVLSTAGWILVPNSFADKGLLAPYTPVGYTTVTKMLADECPSLTSLTLIDNCYNTGRYDMASVGRIKSLRHLKCSFKSPDEVQSLLGELPHLTHLTITKKDPRDLAYARLQLQSPSLESLDISRAGKGLTFDSIDCPNLKELRCGDYDAYGNGLVVATPDLMPVGPPCDRHPKELTALENAALCTFVPFTLGTFPPDDAAFKGPIVLNDSCEVSWDAESWRRSSSPRVVASPTTTLGAFFDLPRP